MRASTIFGSMMVSALNTRPDDSASVRNSTITAHERSLVERHIVRGHYATCLPRCRASKHQINDTRSR